MGYVSAKRAKRIMSTKRSSRLHSYDEEKNGLEFLGSIHPAVREQLAAATDLLTFLESTGGLNLDDRKRIVNQALILFNDNFVHLPLKESMHGINLIQKLQLI